MILVTPKQEMERKSEWFCGVNFFRSDFKVECENFLSCLLNSFSNIDVWYFSWNMLGNNYQLLVTTMNCKLPIVSKMREREKFIRLWKVIRNSSISHWCCKPWNCTMKFHMNKDKNLIRLKTSKVFERILFQGISEGPKGTGVQRFVEGPFLSFHCF